MLLLMEWNEKKSGWKNTLIKRWFKDAESQKLRFQRRRLRPIWRYYSDNDLERKGKETWKISVNIASSNPAYSDTAHTGINVMRLSAPLTCSVWQRFNVNGEVADIQKCTDTRRFHQFIISHINGKQTKNQRSHKNKKKITLSCTDNVACA